MKLPEVIQVLDSVLTTAQTQARFTNTVLEQYGTLVGITADTIDLLPEESADYVSHAVSESRRWLLEIKQYIRPEEYLDSLIEMRDSLQMLVDRGIEI